MPEIQYCKGENMTQEERQVHMKYVLKQLETRNDVVIIDYDFYYSTYITFFYQGYAITVEPNPCPVITTNYPGEILFGVKRIVQDYLGQQVSYWEEYKEFSDVERFLQRETFPNIENPGVYPLSVIINRKRIVEVNHILLMYNHPFAKYEKLYLPKKPFIKGQRVVKVIAVNQDGFPSILVDLSERRIKED